MVPGKIKDAWPVWALVAAGVVIIILTLNQSRVEKEAVAVSDFLNQETTALSSYSADPGGANSTVVHEDPVTSPAIVANTEVGNQVSYAIQLYSFKEQSRADSIVKTLGSQGVNAYVQMSDLGDKGVWYRVRTGSFDTPEKAQAMLAVIRKEHKDSIVVKEKK